MSDFDAGLFKETTRAQWDEAAEAWHRWGPLLNAWLGPATERMLDMAAVASGSRVLDVAAGAGEQTLTAARRVGPTGSVLATDLSPRILAVISRVALVYFPIVGRLLRRVRLVAAALPHPVGANPLPHLIFRRSREVTISRISRIRPSGRGPVGRRR